MRLCEIFQGHELKTLYVCRPLTNAEEVIAWAKEQGFRTCIPAKNLHCTIAYSTKKVDWNTTEPLENTVKVVDGKRKLSQFGDDAIVLQFEDESLHERWAELIKEVGCSWDHNNYNPHVTITFENPGVNIQKIKPYDGELVFGPEKFAEVDKDFKNDFNEINLNETRYGKTQRYTRC